MSVRTARPQKTALIVARRIVADIHQDGCKQGDRLPSEKHMLGSYEVGRGTLRESLRYLELSGAISLKPGPGGGPTVEKPDASHLANSLGLLLQFEGAPFSSIVEVRESLEPLIASLAAQRIGADQLAELEASVQLMRENLADREVFLEANQSFHDIIAWSSGNPLFGYLIDAIEGIFEGAALGVDYPVHRRSAVLKAHSAIYVAIEAKDPAAALDSMREHILELSRYLRKKYPEALEQAVTWDAMH
ncbi:MULTISPECIES: FadR/GntR family transcriptional regulator [Rhodococcus]|uniref:FadR/GntR family transcriptional regulator n=1 Tax=Rhodococcus globerulus TaxID=33008 RepID=UPI001C5679EC|nr:FCD domain-containing protein [Rhodococcus globerulus]QXV99940.1 FCD domain-containing protein [Rhodococcus globerulus]